MKLIALTREPGSSVAEFPDARLFPDSAITLPGKPLFLPDFTPSWEAHLLIGVRVSRLGKDISPRFASRYYDAVALLLRFVPLPESIFSGALASAFDGSIQQGSWLTIDKPIEGPIDVRCGDMSLTISPEDLALDRALSAVSHYLTIRNGDIICPATLPVRLPVSVGDNVTGSIPTLSADTCLSARIK